MFDILDPAHRDKIAGAAGFGVGVIVKVCRDYSDLCKEEKTTAWLSALRAADHKNRTWSHLADAFVKSKDAAYLTTTYHRGFPRMIANGISQAAGLSEPHKWVEGMVENAYGVSQALIPKLSAEDDERRHRLQVFHVISAAQGISMVGRESQIKLCDYIERLLKVAVRGDAGYTDSGCEQILQIVPQILTDQLIAGPNSWRHFFLTDSLLNALAVPTYSVDWIRRFETGIAMTLQFLAYYKCSLLSRNVKPEGAFGQVAKINQCFADLSKIRDPIAVDLADWGRQFQLHAEIARNKPEGHMMLVRQTSAAIIADAYKQQQMPRDLRELCVVNNLRAAARSYGLPDEAKRLERIRQFLSGHGITDGFAIAAADNWMARDKMSLDRARQFASSLPSVPVACFGEGAFAGARGITMDEVVAGMQTLQAERKATVLDLIVETRTVAWVAARISPIVNGLTKNRRESEVHEIEALVQKALADDDESEEEQKA